MLANFQVPDVDGSFPPANGEQAAIGTHLERMHCALKVPLYPHTLSIRHLPPAQPAINDSTDKPLLARNPTQRNLPSLDVRQGAHSLSALRIPQEQLLTISLPLASGACGQLRAIWTPGHTRDGSMMPRQWQHLRATRGIPQVYIAIVASTATRVPSRLQATHRIQVAMWVVKVEPSLSLPVADPLQHSQRRPRPG
jgi:hypothetical protein